MGVFCEECHHLLFFLFNFQTDMFHYLNFPYVTTISRIFTKNMRLLICTFSHTIHCVDSFTNITLMRSDCTVHCFTNPLMKFQFWIPVWLGPPFTASAEGSASTVSRILWAPISCASDALTDREARSNWLTRQATAGAAWGGHTLKKSTKLKQRKAGGGWRGGRYSRKYVRIWLAQTGVITGSKQVYKEESL